MQVAAVHEVSPKIAEIVKACIDSQKVGLLQWADTNHKGSQFTYHAKYLDNGDGAATIRAFDILPPDVAQRCKREAPSSYSLFRAGEKIDRAGTALSCSMRPGDEITITLSVNRGSAGDPPVIYLERASLADSDLATEISSAFKVFANDNSIAHPNGTGWLNTGIMVQAGTELQAKATGRACVIDDSCSDADGGPQDNWKCGSNEITCGALYAKIGEKGHQFILGKDFPKRRMTEAGILYLGYGDVDWANNTGNFDVTITTSDPKKPQK